MKNKYYAVYRHENKINGKSYVGVSMRPYTRWGSNGEGYKANDLFYNDILKYGWDNFNHWIMYITDDKEEAYKKESELIRKFGYYNQTDHVDFGPEFVDASPEVKKNMRILQLYHEKEKALTHLFERCNEEDELASALEEFILLNK